MTRRQNTGIPAGMLIYKIFRADEWADMKATGHTLGAPIDRQDGFVHFSTAAQVVETAARHFAGEEHLTLVTADTALMGEALRWEVSRGGAEFPHLYATFTMDHVVEAVPLPLGDNGHAFPDLL